jgi:hypothetical protein
MGVILPAVALMLLAAPVRVVRAPDPRCPKAAVARAGAERSARRELARLLEERGEKKAAAAELAAKAKVRYGADGGVELTYEDEK